MKKEMKRYYLVEYFGTRETILPSMDEVRDTINEIRKYNNRKSSKFLFGNVSIDSTEEGYHLTAHIYRKFSEKSKISEIDDFTSNYTEKELMDVYMPIAKMSNDALPDINIAYLETRDKDEYGSVRYERGIRYLPVLYKDDLKYMDPKYIRQCLSYHCSVKDFDFFRDLANEFSLHHFISDEVSNLFTTVDKCQNQGLSLNDLYTKANELFSKFILEYERDESLTRDENGKYVISRRRLRDFGFFIKNYNIRDSKIKSPFMYNMPLPKPEYEIEENGQYKLILK